MVSFPIVLLYSRVFKVYSRVFSCILEVYSRVFLRCKCIHVFSSEYTRIHENTWEYTLYSRVRENILCVMWIHRTKNILFGIYYKYTMNTHKYHWTNTYSIEYIFNMLYSLCIRSVFIMYSEGANTNTKANTNTLYIPVYSRHVCTVFTLYSDCIHTIFFPYAYSICICISWCICRCQCSSWLCVPVLLVAVMLPQPWTAYPTAVWYWPTLQQPHTLMLLPTLAAPVLNHTPFAQWSTAQQARHLKREHRPLLSLAQATHTHQMREPCRLFSRLAMPDQMDRLSGDPPLHLGRVTRGARPSGEATNTRASPVGLETAARDKAELTVLTGCTMDYETCKHTTTSVWGWSWSRSALEVLPSHHSRVVYSSIKEHRCRAGSRQSCHMGCCPPNHCRMLDGAPCHVCR